MEVKDVFITGVHPSTFRCGEVAKIIGLKMAKPNEKLQSRLAYQVEFKDGVVDYWPLEEVSHGVYKIF